MEEMATSQAETNAKLDEILTRMGFLEQQQRIALQYIMETLVAVTQESGLCRSECSMARSLSLASCTKKVCEEVSEDEACHKPTNRSFVVPSLSKTGVPCVEAIAQEIAVALPRAQRNSNYQDLKDDCRGHETGSLAVLPLSLGAALPGSLVESEMRPSALGMSKASQSKILREVTVEVEEEAYQPDFGSRILLQMPRRLPWLIGILALMEAILVVATILLQYRQGVLSLYLHVSSVAYGFLASYGAAHLKHSLQSLELDSARRKLNGFVADFNLEWNLLTKMQLRALVVAWFAINCCFGLSIYQYMKQVEDGEISFDTIPMGLVYAFSGVHLLVFLAYSAVVLTVTYVHLNLLTGLDKSLDCWCFGLAETSSFSTGVETWNFLQALLRSVAREIGSSFLASMVVPFLTFTFVVASSISTATDKNFSAMIWESLSALPLLGLFAVNLSVALRGSALTEKCNFIPSFVNQIPTSACIHSERQYLVQYIIQSNAGFCVKEIKLSREIFLKIFIIFGGMVSGLIGAMSRIYA